MIISIGYSALFFYIPVNSLGTNNTLSSLGHPITYWDFSIAIYASIIITGTLMIIADINYYNYLTMIILAFHIIMNILVYFIYDSFKTGYLASGILMDSMGNLYFWLVVICTSGLTLAPFYLLRSIQIFFGESIIHNLRTGNYQKDYLKKKYIKMLEELAKCTRSVVKFKRIFKQNNFEADNYADKRMKEIVENYKQNKKNMRESVKFNMQNYNFSSNNYKTRNISNSNNINNNNSNNNKNEKLPLMSSNSKN